MKRLVVVAAVLLLLAPRDAQATGEPAALLHGAAGTARIARGSGAANEAVRCAAGSMAVGVAG